jgi:hypothetical protein
VALELASPLALFSHRARVAIFLGAPAFHVGVFLVMVPWYWPQMVCYLLVLDWGRIARALRRRPAIGADHAGTAAPAARAARVAALSATAVAALLLAVAVARIEWWPLTHVPMYSAYTGGYDRDALRDEDQARRLAAACLAAEGRGLTGRCVIGRDWFALVARGAGTPARPVFEVARVSERTGGVLPTQARVVFVRLVAQDIVDRPAGQPLAGPWPSSPTTRFLGSIAPWLRRVLPPEYDRVELTMRLRGRGAIVLASVPLPEPAAGDGHLPPEGAERRP